MAASAAGTSSLDQTEATPDWKYEKKKKFKPFEAMRKFFRSSRKRTRDREEDDSNVKAKSTSELLAESGQSEERYRVTTQTRSISEDSIFNPDQKDGQKLSVGQFSKGAKSAENVNENFKSELSRKLMKRQSFHSDDDGLPKSPASSFNTADTLLGRYEGSTVKSAPRDSDQSLLSVGSSDNEEDLFQTNWKATVASVVTRQSNQPKTETPMDVDLSAVLPTTALKSEAARHRISVAPKARRGHGKRTPIQRNANISSLPELTEELPKSQTETSFEKEEKNVKDQDGKQKKPKGLKTPLSEGTTSTSDSVKGKEKSEGVLPTKKETVNSDEENSSDKDHPSAPISGGKKIQLRSTLSDPSSELNKTSNTTSLSKASSLNRDRSDGTETTTAPSEVVKTDSVNTLTNVSKRDSVKAVHSSDENKETKTVLTSDKVLQKAMKDEEAEKKGTMISAMSKTPAVSSSTGQESLSKGETTSTLTMSGSQSEAKTGSVKKISVPAKPEEKNTSALAADSSTCKTISLGGKPVPDKGAESSAAKVSSLSNKFGGQTVSAQSEASPAKVSVGFPAVKPMSDPPAVIVPAKTVSLPSEPAVKSLLSSPVIRYGETKTVTGSASKITGSGKVSQLISKREMNETSLSSVDTQKATEETDETVILSSDKTSSIKSPLKLTTETTQSPQISAVEKSEGAGKPSSKLNEIKESEGATSGKNLQAEISASKSSTTPAYKGLLQSENSATSVKPDSGRVTDSKANSIKASDSAELHRLASPKEDYKTKRQGRSKTLPEQPLVNVPTKSSASTQRNDYDNVRVCRRKPFLSDSVEPENESDSIGPSDTPEEKSESKFSSTSASPIHQVTTSITPASKRPEPKRLSLKDGLFSNSSEPVWVAMARKKNSEETRKADEQSDQPKTQTADSSSVKGTGTSTVSRDIQKQPESSKVQTSKPNFPGGKTIEVKSSSSDDKASVGKSFTIEKTAVVHKPPPKAFSPDKNKPSDRKKETNTTISSVKSVTVDKSPIKQMKAPVQSENTSPSETKAVPAWRTNVGKKKEPGRVLELKKIEIIEKSPPQKSEQQETQTVVLREKSQQEKCVDVSARSSTVLDMVKNFQKLQVS